MRNDIKEILYTKEQIQEMVERIGTEITNDFKDSSKKLLLVCILKGSVVFFADLMRSIDIPMEIDFMQASSYGKGVTTSGTVRIDLDLKTTDLSDYNVVVIEDILDTGNTLYHILNVIRAKGCKEVKLCVLLNKVDRHKREIPIDYEGVKIPDEFVVGYGLDFAENYRNLPYIGILKEEVYSN